MSEDCLVLNVWTYDLAASRLPVLVYFHGGGHSMGSGSWPVYDGAAMARRGAVVVTVNHRLGILGYLPLAELLGDEFRSSGANGILDLVAALMWVQENIESFGGDPGNVTMFGESGGGSKVAALLATPAANGLYSRAAIMSGWFRMRCLPTSEASSLTHATLTQLGLERSGMRELLDIDADRLVVVGATLDGGGSGFAPVVDGDFVTTQPLEAVRSGAAPRVPLLIGTTRDEYSMFLRFAIAGSEGPAEDAALAYLRATFGHHVDQVIETYQRLQPQLSAYEVYEAVATDGNVRFPSVCMADAALTAGRDVYMYRFDWETPLDPSLKAAHGLDVPFVFDTTEAAAAVGGAPECKQLADDMCGAWVAFAESGRPAVASGAAWPTYSIERRTTMLFDRSPRSEGDPGGGERAAWSRYSSMR